MRSSNSGPGRYAVGATLLEVLVVCGMFLGVTAALLTIYFSMIRIEKQVGMKTELDRAIIAAVRHLDSSLKSSRVLEPLRPDAWTTPEEVTRLKLESLKLGADGAPVVTSEGFPEWDPPFEILYENGELVRQTSARRVLAKLRPEDEVTFLRPNKNLLKMRIFAKKLGERGYETSRDTTFQFRLFNQ